jgi:hypothetical protein
MDATTQPVTYDHRFKIFGREGGHPKYEENTNKLYRTGSMVHYVDNSVCCVYCGKYTQTAQFFLYLTPASIANFLHSLPIG